MRLHFSLRGILYCAAVGAVLALAAFALSVYLRGWTVPPALLNARAGQWYASRLGVRYAVGALRIGCLGASCPQAATFSGLDLELATAEPFKIRLDAAEVLRPLQISLNGLKVQFAERRPVVLLTTLQADITKRQGTASGLELGLRPDAPIRIGGLNFSDADSRAAITAIQLPLGQRSSLTLDNVRLENWTTDTSNGWLNLDRIALSGMRVDARRGDSGLTPCEELPASMAVTRQAFQPFDALPAFGASAIQTLRQDAFRVAIGAAILLCVLKLLSVLWTPRWIVRLAFALIPAAAPAVLYFLLGGRYSTLRAILIGSGVLLAVAIVNRIAFYRKGPKWYHRFEPMAVDAAAVLVLLPLFGSGFELSVPAAPSGPGGVAIRVIEVAEIAVNAEGRAPFVLPQVVASGARIALPQNGGGGEARIESVRLPGMQFVAPDASRVTLNPGIVDNIVITFNPERIDAIRVDAHAKVSGLAAPADRLPELRNLEFLRGIDTRLPPVGFSVDVAVHTPDDPRSASSDFSNSPEAVAVNADVGLDSRECTGAFRLAARIRSSAVALIATADGDATGVTLRSAQTLPGSPIRIARGDGRVNFAPSSFDGRFALYDIQRLAASGDGAPRLEMAAESVLATFASRPDRRATAAVIVGPTAIQPASGADIRIGGARVDLEAQEGRQAIAIDIGNTIASRPGSVVNIGGSHLTFDRLRGAQDAAVILGARVEDIRFEDRREGLIEGGFPVLEAVLQGRTSGETIPRDFTGTASFRVSDGAPGGVLIGLANPASLNMNLWEGRVDVPLQDVSLRESVVSTTPRELALRFGLLGRLSSVSPSLAATLDARVQVPHIEGKVGTLDLAVENVELRANAGWDGGETSANLRYGAGDTAIKYSRESASICLSEVAMLDLTTSGSLALAPGRDNTSGQRIPDLPAAPCVSTSGSASDIRLRISGVAPPGADGYMLQVEDASGRGVRIKEIATSLRDLQIPRGRILSTRTGVQLLGVQSLRGGNGLNLGAELSQGDETVRLTDAVISGVDGTRYLTASATRTPTHLTLDAQQVAPADRLLAAIEPFLSDFGMNPPQISSEAQLADLRAQLDFVDGEMSDAAVSARLVGALLLSMSRDVRVEARAPAAAAETSFQLNIGPKDANGSTRIVTAKVQTPELQVRVADDRGLSLNVNGGLRTELRGSLSTGGPAASPILDRIDQTVQGVRAHVARISDLLQPGEGASAPTPRSATWTVHLRQEQPGVPLLRVASDVLEAHVSNATFDAAWSRGSAQSRIDGSGALDSTIALVGDGVIVDARIPLHARFTSPDTTETPVDIDLPVQVALTPRLVASTGAESLWNSEYYVGFWNSHPSRFAQREAAPLIDAGRLTFGNVAIRQAVFPTTPLRIAVGYADALQVDLPFGGRALYGAATGRLQAGIKTADSPALDARVDLALKNIQAGAITAGSPGFQNAFLEDELDGALSLRLDGMPLDADSLAAARAGRFNDTMLEKIGLSLDVQRSSEAASFSGVLQASMDFRLNLVNEVLNKIVNGLRLSGPPRAIAYRKLELKLDVERGVVRRNSPLVSMGGLQLLTNRLIDVEGTVQAHLGGLDERVRLRDLIDMMRGIAAARETD